ncbi:MAG: branched-chain amino acid ABC transporter permease [Methanobacteriota archaeon]|nr:MAG: branched-chain amino acid ABC transporter permease [Euryarchaeota archaeon]
MVLQALLNGLVEASVIVLAAMGLSLIYGVKKFPNFAHGDMMTIGAYTAFYFSSTLRAGIIVGLVASMVFLAILAVVFEFLIFSRLEGRGPVPSLIASVGLALILQNAIRVAFGTGQLTYGIPLPDSWFSNVVDPLTGQQVWINPLQGIVPLVFAFVVVLIITFILQYTKLGKAMRATADNPDLARVTGINVGVVRYVTWALAGALAASGGVMLGFRVNGIQPLLGSSILLLVFAAVILGGIGSPYGAMLGALVIAIAENLFFPFAVLTNTPLEFVLIVPFGIMLLVLLLRPQGLAGRPLGFDLPPLRAELRKLVESVARTWRHLRG